MENDEIGVLPSHLQPLVQLMRPSTGEVAAAQAQQPSGNPALLGAYAIQRMAGLNEARNMAAQSQKDNVALAQQKLQAARMKALMSFFQSAPVADRLEKPNEAFSTATGLDLRSPGMDDLSRQLMQARIKEKLMPKGNSSSEQNTEQVVKDAHGNVVSVTSTRKNKGAAPAPAAAPSGQPQIVKTEKLPDGRTRGYDAQGTRYILSQ